VPALKTSKLFLSVAPYMHGGGEGTGWETIRGGWDNNLPDLDGNCTTDTKFFPSYFC
jgi:hypothetical protein